MNALSEDNSLLQMPVWRNPWLMVAMAVSLGLHAVILYVPFLADIFSIVPLSGAEWALVLAYSLPVIVIDEARGAGLGWAGPAGAGASTWEAVHAAGPQACVAHPAALPTLPQVLKWVGRNLVNKTTAAIAAGKKED